MPENIEDALRRALQTRAADVTPDPATWTRVQEGIRRRERFRYGLLGAGVTAAVAAVAAAAVLIPRLDNGVRLEPGDVAQRPDPEGAGGAEITMESAVPDAQLPPLVTTDGDAVLLPEGGALDEARPLDDGDEDRVRDIAVRPVVGRGVTVAVRSGFDCAARLSVQSPTAGSTSLTATASACVSRPVWSPDGRNLAWIEQDTPGGDARLVAVGWSEDGPSSQTTWALEQPADGLPAPQDWVWTDGLGTETSGYIVVALDSAETGRQTYKLAIERQADRALATNGVLEAFDPPEEAQGNKASIAFADAHESDGVADGSDYHLRVAYDHGDVIDPELVRHEAGDAAATSTPLPPELVASGTGGVWMTALGGDVVVGDGDGAAWHVQWQGDGWGPVTPVAGTVVSADFLPHLDPAAATSPDDEATTPARATPAPTVEHDDSAATDTLPEPVREKRARILDAAKAEDVDALAALVDAEFTSSFGGPEDPREFFQRLKDQGELPKLAGLLELPHTTEEPEGGPTYYAWPFAFGRSYESLSSAEIEMLARVLSDREMQSYQELGEYLAWRVGIRDDGAWVYYVAGD